MGILNELPIRQVFKHTRRLRVGEEILHRSSLCVGQQRLSVSPVRHVFERIVHPLARPETPGAFYRGFRSVGFDATVYDVFHSEGNVADASRQRIAQFRRVVFRHLIASTKGRGYRQQLRLSSRIQT